ncbi:MULTISPECIES: STN domain-containing protein [unclassified Bradyrhizobium]|uniref:STN domain-containing protein n=1 Tax=unclassified Bradyrhizobium TaxID=2631580 RepID=UPI0032E4FFA9
MWGAIVLLTTSVVPQRSRAAEPLVTFDIPAQPLETALGAYGTATGIQLLFDPTLTDGRRTPGLKGTFAAASALNRLLAGSGLAARMIGDAGFTLVALPARGPDDVSPTVQRFNTYSAALQGAMRGALCRVRDAAPGPYRVLVRLWITSSGATERAELLTSSGDERRDGLLVGSLRTLSVGMPPRDLPQPVTLLAAFEDDAATSCAGVPARNRGGEAAR